jgi:hypothetical protein
MIVLWGIGTWFLCRMRGGIVPAGTGLGNMCGHFPPHSQAPAFLLVPKLQLGNALDWKLQLPAAGLHAQAWERGERFGLKSLPVDYLRRGSISDLSLALRNSGQRSTVQRAAVVLRGRFFVDIRGGPVPARVICGALGLRNQRQRNIEPTVLNRGTRTPTRG